MDGISKASVIPTCDHTFCNSDFQLTLESDIEEQELQAKLKQFRCAILDIPGLICPMDDTIFLLRFLRTKKEVKEAVKMLIRYFEFKRDNEEMSLLQISDLTHTFEGNIFTVLRTKHEGARLLYMRVDEWDTSSVTLNELIMTAFYLMEELTRLEETQKNGIIIIGNFKGLSFTQIKNISTQLRYKQIKLLVSIFQGTYPALFKGIHLVNWPYIFNLILALAKPFLKEKIRKRLHVHSKDLTSFHKMISPTKLPQCLGGDLNLEDIRDKEIIQSLLKNADIYKDLSANYGFKRS